MLFIIKYREDNEIFGIWDNKELFENAIEYLLQWECEGNKEYFEEKYEYGTLEDLYISFNEEF